MRLGVATYFIPFALEPSLVLQGEWVQGMTTFVEVLIGTWLIAGGAQAYLPFIGRLPGLMQWLLKRRPDCAAGYTKSRCAAR